jgi:hypothetical protein
MLSFLLKIKEKKQTCKNLVQRRLFESSSYFVRSELVAGGKDRRKRAGSDLKG